MSDGLATYLNDHRAGATMAVELLEAMTEHPDADLAAFASHLLSRVNADRAVLERLMETVGTRSVFKEAAAWAAEKVSRLKLRGLSDDLGVFEALETLALGIAGKRSLWQALGRIAPADARLQGVDYARLAADAQEQADLVNERRLRLAPAALRSE